MSKPVIARDENEEVKATLTRKQLLLIKWALRMEHAEAEKSLEEAQDKEDEQAIDEADDRVCEIEDTMGAVEIALS